MSGRRLHNGLAVWLAVMAALLPLFLPVLPGVGGSIARAAEVGDLFTPELCSLSRAAQDDDVPIPTHRPDQHCPLCRMFQQLGSCMVVEPVAAIAVVWVQAAIVLSSVPSFVPSSVVHFPQPRGPPVRV